jgi:hypothetical protein
MVDIFGNVIRLTVYITDNGTSRRDFGGKEPFIGRFVDLGEGIDSSRSGIRRRGQVGTLLGGDETRSLKTRQYLSELDGSCRVDGFRDSKVMM